MVPSLSFFSSAIPLSLVSARRVPVCDPSRISTPATFGSIWTVMSKVFGPKQPDKRDTTSSNATTAMRLLSFNNTLHLHSFGQRILRCDCFHPYERMKHLPQARFYSYWSLRTVLYYAVLLPPSVGCATPSSRTQCTPFMHTYPQGVSVFPPRGYACAKTTNPLTGHPRPDQPVSFACSALLNHKSKRTIHLC